MSFRSLCNWFIITQVPTFMYILMQYIHVFSNVSGPSAIDFKNISDLNCEQYKFHHQFSYTIKFFFCDLSPYLWEDLSPSLVYSGGWFLKNQYEEMAKQNREFILAKQVGFPIWIRVCIVPLSWIFITKLLYYFWSFSIWQFNWIGSNICFLFSQQVTWHLEMLSCTRAIILEWGYVVFVQAKANFNRVP